MDEIRIGEKTYISSKRAAEITGYAKDYVGQLCREGHVEAKMVGRSWYVYEPSIRVHRFGAEETAPEAEEREVETENQTEEPVSEPVELPSPTWQRPNYIAEEPVQIPEIQDVPKGSVNMLDSAAHRQPEIAPLSDMQRAWEEWFELKRERGDDQVTRMSVQDLVEEADEDEEEAIEEESEAVEDDFEPAEEVYEADTQEEAEEVPFRRISSAQTPVASSQAFAHDVVPVHIVRQEIPAYEPEERVEYDVEPVARHVEPKESRSVFGTAVLQASLIAVSLIAVAVALLGSGIAQPYLESTITNEKFSSLIDILVGERTLNNQ